MALGERPRWFIHAVWASIVMAAYGALVITAWSTGPGEGQCEGLGFGCTPAGSDAAALVAILLSPLVVAALAIGHGAIAVSRWWRERAVHSDR